MQGFARLTEYRNIVRLFLIQRSLTEQLRHADDCVQGSSNFVTHAGKKLRFHARCAERLISCHGQFPSLTQNLPLDLKSSSSKLVSLLFPGPRQGNQQQRDSGPQKKGRQNEAMFDIAPEDGLTHQQSHRVGGELN